MSFDIYKNVDPVNSDMFLSTIKTDDNFASSLKRWNKSGMNEDEMVHKKDIMSSLEKTFQRKTNDIWQLTEAEREEIDKDEWEMETDGFSIS